MPTRRPVPSSTRQDSWPGAGYSRHRRSGGAKIRSGVRDKCPPDFIANLAEGQIGEQAANLLGSLLVSHLQFVAMGRSALASENRVPFFAHIDEFQSFGTDAFASLLSEARKFAAHFCLANQFIEQLAPSVRASVLGNAGALLVFRVSGADADVLASEFNPMMPTELVDQAPYQAWLRRGVGHQHVDLLPRLYPPRGRLELIRAQSRRNFGRPRELIERSFGGDSAAG